MACSFVVGQPGDAGAGRGVSTLTLRALESGATENPGRIALGRRVRGPPVFTNWTLPQVAGSEQGLPV
jgi:hypothetical protein